MLSTEDVHCIWQENGSATTLGRVTAWNGTGAATGINGEGRFVQQSDLSSITYGVYSRDNDGAFTAVSGESGTLVIATNILDTVDATNEVWTQDTVGYNFRHDLPATSFADAETFYLVEYVFTFTGGEIARKRYRGPARGVESA